MSNQDDLEKFREDFRNAYSEGKREILRNVQKIFNQDQSIQKITKSLVLASKEGNIEFVKNILESEFDPNKTDELGNTPLHLAALNGHIDIARLLVKNGANPTLKNKSGKTAIDAAGFSKREDMIKFLSETTSDE